MERRTGVGLPIGPAAAGSPAGVGAARSRPTSIAASSSRSGFPASCRRPGRNGESPERTKTRASTGTTLHSNLFGCRRRQRRRRRGRYGSEAFLQSAPYPRVPHSGLILANLLATTSFFNMKKVPLRLDDQRAELR